MKMNLLPLRPSPPPSKRYGLVISHAWDYKSEYEGLVNLLKTDGSFLWDNLSVPAEAPLSVLMQLPKSYRHLVRQLDERISKADCLLVLAGMYVAHRGWIQSEIEAAKDFCKPIIAVQPRGNERFPEAVMQAADEAVGWHSASIISAILKHVAGPPKLLSPEPSSISTYGPLRLSSIRTPPPIPPPPGYVNPTLFNRPPTDPPSSTPNSLAATITASLLNSYRASIDPGLIDAALTPPTESNALANWFAASQRKPGQL
jgi:hypothetical protein